jgi:hypothetical protein
VKFHLYQPTLADVVFDGALVGLSCFFLLAGLLWLGRWVVSLFEADLSHEDEEGEP